MTTPHLSGKRLDLIYTSSLNTKTKHSTTFTQKLNIMNYISVIMTREIIRSKFS